LKDSYIVKAHHTNLREIYIFTVPVFLACTFLAFLIDADMILVKHFFSPDIAGQYAAAGILAKIVVGIALASAGVMFPTIVEYCSNGFTQKARQALKNTLGLTLCLGAVLTLIIALFPGFVSRLFFGTQYNIDYMLQSHCS